MSSVVERLQREGGPEYAARYPVEVPPNSGRWTVKPVDDWRSGFFPGVLWELHGHSRIVRCSATLVE